MEDNIDYKQPLNTNTISFVSNANSVMKGVENNKNKMKANERAAANLFISLSKFSNIFTIEDERRQIQNKYKDLIQIRHMNSDLLALVLSIIKKYDIQTDKDLENLNLNKIKVKNYINKIKQINGLSLIKQKEIMTKYKLSIYRYLRLIIEYNKDYY